MLDIAGSEEFEYLQKWPKEKLEDKYSHHVVFVQSEGSATMVCLQNMVNYLVREEWYNQRMSDAHGRRVGLGGGGGIVWYVRTPLWSALPF